MKILVTGATGFIGSNLVKELSGNKNYKILCLVRNYKKAKALKPLGAKLIYADTSQQHTLAKLAGEGIEIIFHCAGYVGNNRRLLYKSNVLSTENICRLGLKLNIEKLVYLSSVAVVSGNPQVPLTEGLPYNATNIYGESKIQAEKKVLEFRNKGLKAVILRPAMVYGQAEPHLLPKLCFLIRYSLLPLMDKGRKKLHLVYVENVVKVMIYALGSEGFLKGTFFIADNEVLSVAEIFDIITDELRAQGPWNLPSVIKPLFLKVPYIGRRLKFFLKDRVYSIQGIKSLGFNPPYSTEEYLRKSVRDLKK